MNTTPRGLFALSITFITAAALATACGKKNESKPAEAKKPAAAAGENAIAKQAAEAKKAGAEAGKAADPAAATPPAANPTAANPTAANPAAAAAKPAAGKGFDSVDWNDDKAIMARAKGPGGLPAPADVAAPPADATKTPSGLMSKVLKKGTGDKHPGPRDVVKCHYIGWQTDGTNFDASYKHGNPLEFGLNQVISGWTEGLQLMVVGEKRRFWIPEKLAYQGRDPKGMLVFDVELLGFKPAPKPPEAPKNLTAPPKDATREKSGLAWKILKKGTGTKKPTLQNVVKLDLDGWTSTGQLLDSSKMRGQPAVFPLGQAPMQGWKDGIQMMVEGEKRRFWIPEELALKGRPGAPQGMLVFDFELKQIVQ